MKRIILKSKIHKATVTETNINYEGSLTLDQDLMKASDIIPYEQIQVYNISNGERFVTYLIKGKAGSGIVGINGAAAHKAKKGDQLIIATYAEMDEKDIDFIVPTIIILDEKNNIKEPY